MTVGKKYTKAQAQNLITILAYHNDANGRIVAQLIQPELFPGELRIVAERCVEYWKEYDKAPGNHVDNLFADILEDEGSPGRAATFKRILANVALLDDGLNVEYVLHMLRTTTRTQRMKGAILKSAEILNEQQELGLEEAEEILSDLLRAREYQFDTGLSLKDVDRVLDFLEAHYSEFSTGIEPFDRRNIVPARGSVFLWLAPTGFGKTWALIHTGKQAMLQRKRVVHISLEMAEEQVAQRYYQNLFSIAKRPDEFEVMDLDIDDVNLRLKDVDKMRMIKVKNNTFEDRNFRKYLKRELKPWIKRRLLDRLVIKRFTPRSLSMSGLRAYLDTLEATTGFIPDMIVLDYVGICKTDESNQRISLGRVMEEFRAVCIERNAAGVTAHQVSKKGAESFEVKATHVAEDWSLIQTTDTAVTYSRTPAEKKRGLARLLVAKARFEEDQFSVVITQSYGLGQFVLQSAMLTRRYRDYVDGLIAKEKGEVEEDEDDEK